MKRSMTAMEAVTPVGTAAWGMSTRCRAWITLFATSALGLLVGPPPALASQASTETEAPAIREISRWEAVPSGGRALWFWREGQRAYQLVAGPTNHPELVAYDLERHSEVNRVQVAPPVWGLPPASELHTGGGHHFAGSVDETGGRLFFAYESSAGGVAFRAEGAPSCPSVGAAGDTACVEGVHVFDAATLELTASIPLNLVSADGRAIQPILRGLEYLPPDPVSGLPGRVLLVVDEVATGKGNETTALRTGNENAIPRRNGANIAWAIQVDPDGGRQEWAVRLDGCRNAREARGVLNDPHPAPVGIFRGGGPSPALYVGCHSSAAQTGVVVRVPLDTQGFPSALPVTIGDPSAITQEDDQALRRAPELLAPAERQQVFSGPDKTLSFLADPPSQRMLLRTNDGKAEVWWVFDAHQGAFVGTIGIGEYGQYMTKSGIDPINGRLYVLAAGALGGAASGPGGLYVADVRRTPLPQALHMPELADPPHDDTVAYPRPLSILPGESGEPTRVYAWVLPGNKMFRVLADELPVSVDPPTVGFEGLTQDLDEAPGVTTSTFDGVARGFGVRAIVVGGAEGAARVGPADPIGLGHGGHDRAQREAGGLAGDAPLDRCADAQREVVVAFVGPESPATLDASGARGSAQPVLIDGPTRDDAERPITRCAIAGLSWEQLWTTALTPREPVREPSAAWPFQDSRSSCISTEDGARTMQWSDPVTGAFSSRADCSDSGTQGWGQARGVSIEDLSVSQAISSFRVYLDPQRGIVSQIESIARGIDIGGVVKIDTVRGRAESWANGRRGHATEASDAGAANCDYERTAGTCFSRSIVGVHISDPGGATRYRCGPCGNEDALANALRSALGANGSVRFREPDPRLARGAENGYLAAIQKRDSERYADTILNSDLLETVVPALEIIRYAPQNRPTVGPNNPIFGVGTRGRQIYQFAGVEVSSAYSIQCTLVYDAITNTCGAPEEPTASLTVSVSDQALTPLAGASFEVRHDGDRDGIPGLGDTLIPAGACLTDHDGIGSCRFSGLAPGHYLVSQVSAPTGFAPANEPYALELQPGALMEVSFVNATNMSTVRIEAADEHGQRLVGAAFAAYPDPDADGRIDPGAEPAANCTTDATGTCTMTVPVGNYVLVQKVSRSGLDVVDPVAFSIASGGQTASVTIVNYPVERLDGTGETAAEVVYKSSPPLRAITTSLPQPHRPATVSRSGPAVGVTEAVGGTVVRVISAPGDALRLLRRNPKEALAFLSAMGLLALAIAAGRRRAMLDQLASGLSHAAPPARSPRTEGAAGPPGGSRFRPDQRQLPPSGTNGWAGQQVAGPSRHGFEGVMLSTRLLERVPIVAGGAPNRPGDAVVAVALATPSPALAALVRNSIATGTQCRLVACVQSVADLRSLSARAVADVLVVDLNMRTEVVEDICDLLARNHVVDRAIGLVPPMRAHAHIARGHAAGLASMLHAEEDLINGQLALAIRAVAAGRRFYGPYVQTVMMRVGSTAGERAIAAGLSERQLEIARLAASGMKRSTIASRLFLSPQTVKGHLRAIRTKLGVTDPWDNAQLHRRLVDLGLLTEPETDQS